MISGLCGRFRIHFAGAVGRIRNSVAGRAFQCVFGFAETHIFPVQILLLLLYRGALDLVYLKWLSPRYAYSGFTTDISLPLYLLSWVLLAVIAPFTVGLHQDDRPSASIVLLLSYFYFVPLTSYSGCKGSSLSFLLFGAAYWVLLLIFQYVLPPVAFKPLALRHSRMLFTGISVFSALLVLFVSGKYTHFRIFLNFIDVYGVRAEAAGYQMPGILSYLLSFMTITLSMSLLFWLQRKKYAAVVGLLVIYLFYYSIAADKSNFLFLLLLLGCYWVYRPWMRRYAALFLSGGILGVGLCCSVVSILPMSMLMRRLMYIPVQISEACQQFAAENPWNLFRYGIMGKLGFSPLYTQSIPRVIGEFMGELSTNANNGLLGDLFVNLPAALGLLLMPLVLVLCFRLLDMVSRGLPQKIFISFCVYHAVSFINTSWSTVLLSHGFLLNCVLLYIFPRKEMRSHELSDHHV